MDIKAKRRRFNALLAGAKMMNAKEALLSGYGVESTMDLEERQLDSLIKRVEEILHKKKVNSQNETREWRHKCLRMIAACGVNTQDWEAVNAFMLSKRIAGKHLYELTNDELKVLHKKLHNVKENYDKKKLEIKRITTQN